MRVAYDDVTTAALGTRFHYIYDITESCVQGDTKRGRLCKFM